MKSEFINMFDDFFEEEDVIPTYISKCSKIYPPLKLPVGIPKIIMQTWKNTEIPDKWAVSPESVKSVMSDWTYVLMTDEDNRNLIAEHFPDFLPYYDAFPHAIQRADAVRYAYLYVYGGIYMDLDFEVQRDLSPLFVSTGEVFLVASGNVSSYYTNSFMASRPRAKFWLEVIEEMKRPNQWWYIGKHIEVMNTTGPIMLSRVARNTKTVIGVVPRKLVMPCSICNLNCSTCESFLKPLEGSSWTTFDTTFYNFFLCNYWTVLYFIICLLLLLLIVWIVYKTGLSNVYIYPSDLFNFFRGDNSADGIIDESNSFME